MDKALNYVEECVMNVRHCHDHLCEAIDGKLQLAGKVLLANHKMLKKLQARLDVLERGVEEGGLTMGGEAGGSGGVDENDGEP